MNRRESVDALRNKIDQVDAKIVGLLNQRASLAQKIGQIKALEKKVVYVPGREQTVLAKVSRLTQGPLSADAVRRIYREILSASRSLEAPLKVAYLGPQATFTHMAAQQRFGGSVAYVPAATIRDVFEEVGHGRVDYGVVPIENTTEGVVTHTLDTLVEANVPICGELTVNIELHLLSRNGRPKAIKRILSHPQALAQCRAWLSNHYPHVPIDEVTSTAQAAKLAYSEKNAAAICSELAGACYGLKVVHRSIQDNPSNITRFFVIGNKTSDPSGRDKTTIVFSVKDEVGILHRMLEPFSKSQINLTKIESRPSKRKPWEYFFFLDFNGHQKEPKVRKALEQLAANCLFVKVLGSYPCSL